METGSNDNDKGEGSQCEHPMNEDFVLDTQGGSECCHHMAEV